MTTDQAIRDAKARWARRRRRLIGYGQWQPFTDAEPIRQHVLAIRATGMGLRTLAARAGVTVATVDHLIYGNSPHPPAAKIRTENAKALLAYWPTLDDYDDGSIIDATGTRRRLQALAAIGWPVSSLHHHINIITVSSLERLRFNQQVTARVARAVRDVYQWASVGTAEDHGITPWIAERGRGHATRRGWAKPVAWDDDTIDNPDAHPDITGQCGTDQGWWTHRRQQLPTCSRCEQAHQQWLDERVNLHPQERNKELFRARAAAGRREADLAHDARELFQHGADADQAAARLGITRPHLHQILKRHPDLEAAA
ncbi:hypothetical protein ACI3K5_23950 [Streptomyces sp. MPA0124]|uniref:hypothetical protein n=1 Tax=Streptomyces sp. MPA0124 TaxID=3378069 RepID=UPI003854ECC6